MRDGIMRDVCYNNIEKYILYYFLLIYIFISIFLFYFNNSALPKK